MGRRAVKIVQETIEEPKKTDDLKVTPQQLDQDMDEIEELIKKVWKSMVVSEAKSLLSGNTKGHVTAQGSYTASSQNYNVRIGFNIDRYDWWGSPKSDRRKLDNSISIRITPAKNTETKRKSAYWISKERKDKSFVSLKMNTPVLEDVKLKDVVRLAKIVMKGVQK